MYFIVSLLDFCASLTRTILSLSRLFSVVKEQEKNLAFTKRIVACRQLHNHVSGKGTGGCSCPFTATMIGPVTQVSNSMSSTLNLPISGCFLRRWISRFYLANFILEIFNPKINVTPAVTFLRLSVPYFFPSGKLSSQAFAHAPLHVLGPCAASKTQNAMVLGRLQRVCAWPQPQAATCGLCMPVACRRHVLLIRHARRHNEKKSP